MSKSLISIIQGHMTERSTSKKEGACPAWVKPLVTPDLDDPEAFTFPQCVMTAQLDPFATTSGPQPKSAYYRLDATKTLALLLRHTRFVEFPTIEVWEEFRGTVVDTQGAVTQSAVEERRPKRRKLNSNAGKKAISGLLGGYGSEEEAGAEPQSILAMLGGYAGSDDEDELGDEDAEGETDDEVEVEVEADPVLLFEMMQQARGEEDWTIENREDEDVVDWGDDGPE